MMLPDPKIRCPYTGFKTACRAIVSKHDCPKFVHIIGTNPNNNQQIDKFGCIDSFLHVLLIENTQMQHQTGASTDKVANVLNEFKNGMFELSGAPRLERPRTRVDLLENGSGR